MIYLILLSSSTPRFKVSQRIYRLVPAKHISASKSQSCSFPTFWQTAKADAKFPGTRVGHDCQAKDDGVHSSWKIGCTTTSSGIALIALQDDRTRLEISLTSTTYHMRSNLAQILNTTKSLMLGTLGEVRCFERKTLELLTSVNRRLHFSFNYSASAKFCIIYTSAQFDHGQSQP